MMDTSQDPVLRQLAQSFEGADLSPEELHSVIPFLFFSAGGAAQAPSPAVQKHLDAFCREAGIDASLAPQDVEARVHAHFHAHPPSARVLDMLKEILGGAELDEQESAGQQSMQALGGARDNRPVDGRSRDGFRLGALGAHGMQQALDIKREPVDVPCGKPGDTPTLSEPKR